jgi:tRNA pseudouridine65 synthase
MDIPLEILYKDDHLVAINKPHDLLVHRTKIARNQDRYALQILRDQLGQKVYPVHRLDSKTSGVLLFALDNDVNIQMQKAFAAGKIKKTYWAILRGYTDQEGTIDYPVKNKNGVLKNAITHYRTIDQKEINVALGKFNTSRYSFVEVLPKTGRMHQIRRHFAHLRHPIIADRPHGCSKQNKLFKERWGMKTMLLHARSLEFSHPNTAIGITIEANLFSEFNRMIQLLGFEINEKSLIT